MEHLIEKQLFDLNFSQLEGAQDFQQELSNYFQLQMLPQWEKLFDELVPEDVTIRIDRLEIDLGTIMKDEFFRIDLIHNINRQLREEILKHRLPAEAETGEIHATTSAFREWLYFLEKGVKPWYGKAEQTSSESNILSELASHEQAKHQLLILLNRKPASLQRLILQYPDSFLLKLRAILFPSLRTISRSDLDQIKGLARLLSTHFPSGGGKVRITEKDFRKLFWLGIWKKLSLRKNIAPDFQLAEWGTLVVLAVLPQEIRQFVRKNLDPIRFPLIVKALEQPILREESPTPDQLGPSSVDEKNTHEFSNGHSTKGEEKKRKPAKGESPPSINGKKDEAHVNDRKPDTPHLNNGEANRLPFKKDQPLLPDESIHGTNGVPTEEYNKQTRPNKTHQEPDNARDHARKDQEKILSDIEKMTLETTPSEPMATQSFYFIEHAGLVLLHPYFQSLFLRLGWLNPIKFASEDMQTKALHMMYYLYSGLDTPEEHQLILPKILGGVPLNIPQERFVRLEESEKEEADHMLEAVLANWGALGGTSPDGLREGFLKRPGKLIRKDLGWHLHVESQTLDVLLDRLPWTIGMVKTPWMKELMTVEWR